MCVCVCLGVWDVGHSKRVVQGKNSKYSCQVSVLECKNIVNCGWSPDSRANWPEMRLEIKVGAVSGDYLSLSKHFSLILGVSQSP